MMTISFEKLRAQFHDASFILVPYHAQCSGFQYDFQFDYKVEMIKRAWENLDRAKRFVAKVRPEYPAGDPKVCLDKLDELIVESYIRIVTTTATANVKYVPPIISPEVDINDEFLF